MASAGRLRFVIPRFATSFSSLQSVTIPNLLRRSQHFYQYDKRRFVTTATKQKRDIVTVNFKFPDGSVQSVKTPVGENLLDVIIDNDVELDGFGACEGTLACSTCHLIFSKADYEKIAEKPTDEELDMLDLAYGLTDTSRLGCQVIVTKDMDEMEVQVPAGFADAREV